MWQYNQSVDPPALFVEVIIAHPVTGEQRTISAKLDTAADISTIPAEICKALGLIESASVSVEGYDGTVTALPIYIVAFELPAVMNLNLQVIAIPETYMLIGRDVLNRLYAKLNGPALNFELSATPL